MDQAKPFPLSKSVIWVMCLLLTPLCGAVLYYAWKKENPDAAKYANRVSWLTWLIWIGLGVVWYLIRGAGH